MARILSPRDRTEMLQLCREFHIRADIRCSFKKENLHDKWADERNCRVKTFVLFKFLVNNFSK